MRGLIDFIHAQLDEAERRARQRIADHTQFGPSELDPDDALAEIDAKRQILGEHRPVVPDDPKYDCPVCWVGAEDGGPERFPCLTVRLLALPYAGRPGYRDEWRPEA